MFYTRYRTQTYHPKKILLNIQGLTTRSKKYRSSPPPDVIPSGDFYLLLSICLCKAILVLMIRISYSQHALDRLRKRGISKQLVREAIEKGQERKLQLNLGTIKCTYSKNGVKLIVVYIQKKENFKIVTTYYQD